MPFRDIIVAGATKGASQMQSNERRDLAIPRPHRRGPNEGYQMRSNERGGHPGEARTLSLILPLLPGTVLDETTLTDYRRLLEESGAYRSVELIVAGPETDPSAAPWIGDGDVLSTDGVTVVRTEGGDWDELRERGYPSRPAIT